MDIILEDLKDKYNSRALIVRGDALYNLGNFERFQKISSQIITVLSRSKSRNIKKVDLDTDKVT